MTTPEELYLPRVKSRYANVAAVVEAAGCRLVEVESIDERPLGVAHRVGHGPTGLAQLCADGTILHERLDRRSYTIEAVLHEAMHWICGLHSLDEEYALMPYQLAVVRRIANDEERRVCLREFRYYGVAGEEINDVGELLREHRTKWTRHEDWRAFVAFAKNRGLPLNGRIVRREKWL